MEFPDIGCTQSIVMDHYPAQLPVFLAFTWLLEVAVYSKHENLVSICTTISMYEPFLNEVGRTPAMMLIIVPEFLVGDYWKLSSLEYCRYLEIMFQILFNFLCSCIVSYRKTGRVAWNT